MLKQSIIGSIVLTLILLRVSVIKTESNTFKMIEITPKDQNENQFLMETAEKYAIEFWEHSTKMTTPVVAFVDEVTNKDFIEALKQKKIKYKLEETDSMFALMEKQMKGKTASRDSYSEFAQVYDYHQFNNLDAIFAELDRLQTAHPNRVEVVSMGMSYEGRHVKAVNLFKPNQRTNKIVVIECGIHSNEWMSHSFCMWTINQLLNSAARLLQNYDFLIIPVLNPDGYVFTWSLWNSSWTQGSIPQGIPNRQAVGGRRLYRKNRTPNPFPGKWWDGVKNAPNVIKMYTDDNQSYNLDGIDINRNFPTTGFCNTSINRVMTRPPFMNYCGTDPLRAPEASALANYLLPIKDKLVAYFSIHAYGQYWMYPYAYSETINVTNIAYLRNLSAIAVDAILQTEGTTYTFGRISEMLGYLSSGDTVTYAYDTLGVSVAFAIEVRPPPSSNRRNFIQPDTQIRPNGEELLNGIEAVLNQMTADSTNAPAVEALSGDSGGLSTQMMASIITIIVILISASILRFI